MWQRNTDKVEAFVTALLSTVLCRVLTGHLSSHVVL